MNTDHGADTETTEQEPSNRSHLLTSPNAESLNHDSRDGGTDQMVQNQSGTESGSGRTERCCSIRQFNKIIAAVSPNEICPTMTKLHFLITRIEAYAIFVGLLYALSFSLSESIREPALQLAALFVLAQIFGAVTALAHLPPLLGMLLAGVLLKNVGYFHAEGIFLKITGLIRSCALATILLRAGLGLDASALRRLSMVVIRVAVIPCSIEAVTVAIVSHYILNFPWSWGFLLGFVLGAVSPAVVVPSLLALQSSGYGENKGISTLVIAASSLDDIYAITMFGVFLSSIFSKGSVTEMLIQGPLEILIGVAWGISIGIVLIYLPHPAEQQVTKLRTIMVGVNGIWSVLISQIVGYAGAGPLGCIVSAFVASCGWRAFSSRNTYEPVMKNLTECWLFLQPFLFGLIGTEINLFAISGEYAMQSLFVMIIGVVVRLLACCISVQGCGLNKRETLFVGLSWLPKATVQAAIGPVALDMARNSNNGNIELAEKVLTIAVLSIILTAPLGAIGIQVAGPRLLTKSETKETIVGPKSDAGQEDAEMQVIV